MHTDGEQI